MQPQADGDPWPKAAQEVPGQVKTCPYEPLGLAQK